MNLSNLIAVIGVIVAIIIPLVTFAYKNPKGFSVFKWSSVKYTFLVWWAICVFVMTLWLGSKLNLLTVHFFSQDFIQFLDRLDGFEIFVIIVTPPIIVWFTLNIVSKVSNFGKVT
ncbi:TPA: hypothetical protein NGR42_004463 [Vibrio parahaemolyticus]|uniref:hypothetical protein n=1 Tax=Vibrio anguillarum TaxID=55601 RepID=UPI001A7E05B4